MGKKKKNQDQTVSEAVAEETLSEEQEPTVEVVESVEEQLHAEVEQAQAETRAAQEQYLRTLADMDNLRKRTQREKEELAKFANEAILRDILEVVDNLERAVEHAEKTEMGETGEGLLEGVQMTLGQFSQLLKKFAVTPVEALGQTFDPAHHQAMGQLETTDFSPNSVAQEMQRGYLLNDRLLRPSLVMVAKAPAEPVVADEDNTTTETDEQK